MKPHHIAMNLIAVGALVAGWLLLPGESERIAMLERDGRNREALRILESRFAAGDNGQRTLFQMQQLYEHFGELAKARQTLEMLAELRPRDIQVQRQLANFYKQTQDESAYILQLKNQIAIRYSEPACRELIGIERRNGAFASEQTSINLCRQKGYRRTEDLIRLADLLASDGDFTQASALLRSIDDLRRLKTDRDRLQLFAVLLKLEQPKDALRRAIRWLKGQREEELALTLVDMLVRAEKFDAALELAREISTPGDQLSLTVAELLLDRGQHFAARTYLRGWLDRTRPATPELVNRFIAVALDAEDPALALSGAQAYGLAAVSQQDLVSIAEALGATSMKAEFEIIRGALLPETLAANPLLRATVAINSGATSTTSRYLGEVAVDDLDEWRLALWSRLMRETGRTDVAEATIRDLGIEATTQATPNAKIIRRAKRAKRYRSPVTASQMARKESGAAGPRQAGSTERPSKASAKGGG